MMTRCFRNQPGRGSMAIGNLDSLEIRFPVCGEGLATHRFHAPIFTSTILRHRVRDLRGQHSTFIFHQAGVGE